MTESHESVSGASVILEYLRGIEYSEMLGSIIRTEIAELRLETRSLRSEVRVLRESNIELVKLSTTYPDSEGHGLDLLHSMCPMVLIFN